MASHGSHTKFDRNEKDLGKRRKKKGVKIRGEMRRSYYITSCLNYEERKQKGSMRKETEERDSESAI